jgi:TIR domain
MAYKVFISYSHQDKALRDELDIHLANLKRQNIITSWYDGDIKPGEELQPQIIEYLNTAQIILLLVSANFIASDFCYSTEMKQAITRHNVNKARVIPILLRPTDWQGAPFAKLKMLPTDAKAITMWTDHDEGFVDVIKGIRQAIDELSVRDVTAIQERRRNISHARNPLFIGSENMRLQNEPVGEVSVLPDMPALQTLSSQGSVKSNPTEYQIQVNLSKGAKIGRSENTDAKTNSAESRILEATGSLIRLRREDRNAYLQACARWSERAEKARKDEDWEEESICWEILRDFRPYIVQARERRKIVKQNQQYKYFYDQAKQHAENGDKEATKDKLLELWQKAPFYGDPAGLAWRVRLYIPLGGWHRRVWMSLFWSGFASLIGVIIALIFLSNIPNSQFFPTLLVFLAILTFIIFSVFFYLNYRWIYLKFAYIDTPPNTTVKPGVNSR